MIKLFRKDETDFNHNEWILSDTIKCTPIEDVNSTFELDFEYPVQDRKGLSKHLVTGNIIKCPVGDSREDQLFRIRKTSGDKVKKIFAQALLIADLSANRIKSMIITGKTRKEAIQMVLNASLDPHKFVVGNKDTNTNRNVVVEVNEGSVLNALVGSENSILSAYGGEFIIDNFTFDIVDSRGTDRSFDIRYGKNIKGITPTEDDTDLATVIIPRVGDLRLPEYIVQSPNVNKYEKRYFKELDLQGLKVWNGEGEKKDDEITEEEAYIKMRESANLLFTKNHVDLISFTYELDLAILGKTEEYKSKLYYLMEDVFLGDTVGVKHEVLDIDLFGKVTKTVYNVLLNKYDSVTVGFRKQNITDIINNTMRTIKFTEQSILLKVEDLSNKTSASIEILKNQIAERVTEDEMWSLIQLNPDKILLAVNDEKNGTDVIINTQGLEVHRGKFRIYNADGEKIFAINQSGRVLIYEMLEIANDNGDLVDVTGGGITFWNNDEFLARIDCISDMDGMLVLESNNGDLSLKGERILINGTSINTLIRNLADVSISNLNVDADLDMGWNGDTFSYEINNVFYMDGRKAYFVYLEANTKLYAHNADVDNDLWVGGDLDVEGDKNCLQSTESYGKRRISAYETAECHFGDIGSGIIKNGECIVSIEDIFSECVNTEIEYQVDIFEYKHRGSITDVERYPNYFIVKGEIDNIEFGWEIKAKRKGYENARLEEKIDLKEEYEDVINEDILLKTDNYITENVLLGGNE